MGVEGEQKIDQGKSGKADGEIVYKYRKTIDIKLIQSNFQNNQTSHHSP
jgi:hypothetical protein